MKLRRGLLRVLASFALLGVMIGVPIGLGKLVGFPLPSISELRDAWRHNSIDSELVLTVGAAIFTVLWLWFVVTAFAELLHVIKWRFDGSTATLRPLTPGPNRWVRRLMRFIAVSSVSATAAIGSLVSPAGPKYGVAHSASAAPIHQLGAVEPPIASPVTADGPSAMSSYIAGLGTALLLSAGAVGVLEQRRRRQWRAATVGTQLATPTPTQIRTETALRAIAGPERLARLDVALRAAAADLAAQGAVVMAALLSDFGEVRLFLRGSATPRDDNWQLDVHANTWRLSAETPLHALAPSARLCAQPCPALVHLGGVAHGGELFVDLEAVGVLSVVSPDSTAILRHAAASLAVSPFLETMRLFTVGVGDVGLAGDGDGVEQVDSLDAALDVATMALGSTMAASRSASTFALRVTGVGGEAWEPAIVVAAGSHEPGELAHLASITAPNRGLAVMVDADLSGTTTWLLRADGDGHVLEPIGVRLAPVGCEIADVAAVADLLSSSEIALAEPTVSTRTVSTTRFVEPDWSVMVRVLGQVEVHSQSGVVAEFERSKALELVVWLSQHRRRPTRSAARTALWDLDVRDATFANVVSDARRGMARAVAPPDGDEWIARTLTEDLPLHGGVVTDAELLTARVEYARGLPPLDAIQILRPGLELVAGMPFAGTGYLWPDAEGATSSLVLLATGAAIELATHYLAVGDVAGVFWATGQGLKVLAGHEELIALRMRSQARNGDLAGVRHEWESYERALQADPWAAAEPSPKLVALRRELLTPSFAQASG